MRGKEFVKGIGFGLAVAALVGGVFQVAQVISAAQEDSPALRTGAGHFGDAVAYLMTWNHEYLHDGETCRAQGVGRSTYQVEGPVVATNQSGTPFTAAVVTEHRTDPNLPPKCGAETIRKDRRFIDLSGRQVVKIHRAWNRTWEGNLYNWPPVSPQVQKEGNGTDIRLAPEFGEAGPKEYATHPSLWSAILFQNMTFETGQDVSHVLGRVRNHSPLEMNHRARIELVGASDGRAVFVIHITEAHNESGQEEATTWRYEWRMEQRLWFRDGDAWPFRSNQTNSHLYYEAGILHESWVFESNATLVATTSGTRPMPWGAPTRSPEPRTVEWSPRSYPITGNLNRIPYTVEEAITSVERDSTLATFTAWRIQNPAHRLVGFHYRSYFAGGSEARNELQIHAWELTYSAPFGATVYRATSEWRDGLIVNRGKTMEVPDANRFDPAWVPTRFPTLHSVDRQWKNTMDPGMYDRGPNLIWWGMQPGAPSNAIKGGLDQFFKHVGYGRFISSSSTQFYAQVFVRAETNDVQLAIANQFVKEPTSVAPKLGASPPASLGAEAPHAGPTIDPWVASVTAFSIFLAAYLYPALQQAFLSMFSKIARHRLLHHRLRSTLHDAIQQDPGISRAQLQAKVDAPMSTVIHHLRVMEQHHVVTSVRDGRNLRFFPGVGVSSGLRQELTVLQNERTRQTLDLVRAQPGVDRQTLAQLLNLTVPAVAWHLDRLQEAALVRVEKRGRTLAYFLAKETPHVNLQTSSVQHALVPVKT